MLEPLEKGHEVVILRKNSKSPLFAGWQGRLVDRMEFRYWLGKGHNYGIRTNKKLVVVDKDARDSAAFAWLRKNGLYRTKMVVESPHGLHLYYRLPDEGIAEARKKIRHLGMPLDLICGDNFVVGPGSRVADHDYRLRPHKRVCSPGELLPFPAELLMETRTQAKEVRAGVVAITRQRTRDILRPDLYALRIPSVMGQHGSAGLVRVICVLRDCGWSSQQTFEFMTTTWNVQCAVPQWSHEEILYAVNRHYGAK